MQIEFLADHPDAVQLISKWYFDEWGHVIPNNSLENVVSRVSSMLNRDKIPLHLLAIENGEILGVTQLKIREMTIYPEKEHWVGGVYVKSSARGKNVATKLVSRAIELAKEFGVKTLYLQTEATEDGGLYARLGWKPIEKVHYNGVHVLVMENAL